MILKATEIIIIHLGSSGAYPVSGVDQMTFDTIAVSPVVNQLWPAF